MELRKLRPLAVGLATVLLAGGCATGGPATSPAPYTPQERYFTLTAVPLLTKELQGIYPFLKEDFAQGGVLEGKEVYAFLPSTLTVVEGDTIHFTFQNPEDDEHRFALEGLVVPLPPQSITHATLVAHHPGIFMFACIVPAHIPAMYGQLVVLPASVGAGFEEGAPGQGS